MSAMPTDPPETDPTPITGEVERITTAEADDRPTVRFQVDDDDTVLIARKPKTFVLLQLIRAEARGSIDSLDSWMAAVLDDAVVVDPDEVQPEPEEGEEPQVVGSTSYGYLVKRLYDDDDGFDLPQITAVKNRLMELWSGNPTGGSGGSSPGPRRSGKRSKGRQR